MRRGPRVGPPQVIGWASSRWRFSAPVVNCPSRPQPDAAAHGGQPAGLRYLNPAGRARWRGGGQSMVVSSTGSASCHSVLCAVRGMWLSGTDPQPGRCRLGSGQTPCSSVGCGWIRIWWSTEGAAGGSASQQRLCPEGPESIHGRLGPGVPLPQRRGTGAAGARRHVVTVYASTRSCVGGFRPAIADDLVVARGGEPLPASRGERATVKERASNPLGRPAMFSEVVPLLMQEGRVVLNGRGEGFSPGFVAKQRPGPWSAMVGVGRGCSPCAPTGRIRPCWRPPWPCSAVGPARCAQPGWRQFHNHGCGRSQR